MSLQDQINEARANIRTDTYEMSIGEWISLYKSGELEIHPEFQRFYRWTIAQKSRFIESILLGIPIPQIFVVQRNDGIWDVVDGVQRLSTIFQLVGILKDEKGEIEDCLKLERTKYLPELEGKLWESNESDNCLTDPQKLTIKRARLGVSIVLKESDYRVQYELFQRLNTGGSQLSDQELRNCLIVMANLDFYEWLKDLNDFDPFKNSIALTDKAILEQYDMELLLRFIIFRNADAEKYNLLRDVGEFITDETLNILDSKSFNRNHEETAFRETFSYIERILNGDAFRRFDFTKNRYGGGFLLSAFETVALGIGYHYKEIRKMDDTTIAEAARNLWKNEEFLNNSGSGVRASSRIPKLLPLGREIFSP